MYFRVRVENVKITINLILRRWAKLYLYLDKNIPRFGLEKLEKILSYPTQVLSIFQNSLKAKNLKFGPFVWKIEK